MTQDLEVRDQVIYQLVTSAGHLLTKNATCSRQPDHNQFDPDAYKLLHELLARREAPALTAVSNQLCETARLCRAGLFRRLLVPLLKLCEVRSSQSLIQFLEQKGTVEECVSVDRWRCQWVASSLA